MVVDNFPLTWISIPIPRHTFLLVIAQPESHGNPHSLIFKKKSSPSGLYMVLDQCQGTKLSDLVVRALVLQMKYAGSNPPGCIFITCLKVVSLLKKLFFLHKQSLPQQQTR